MKGRSTRLSHDAAWRGGSSLVLDFRLMPAAAGDGGVDGGGGADARLCCRVGEARVFVLDVPLPAGGLRVTMVWRAGAAPARAAPELPAEADPSPHFVAEPVLLARDAASGALRELRAAQRGAETAAAAGSSWRRSEWLVTGAPGDTLCEFRIGLALENSGGSAARRGGWARVRIGLVEIEAEAFNS